MAGFASDLDDAVAEGLAIFGDVGGENQLIFAALEVDLIDAGGGGVGQFVSVRREAILMEIEAFAVGFFGEAHHAMAGVFVDPFLERGLAIGRGPDLKCQASVGVAPLRGHGGLLAEGGGLREKHGRKESKGNEQSHIDLRHAA